MLWFMEMNPLPEEEVKMMAFNPDIAGGARCLTCGHDEQGHNDDDNTKCLVEGDQFFNQGRMPWNYFCDCEAYKAE